MRKLQRDFLLGEWRRLALCAVGFLACVLILMRFSPKLAPRLPLLLAAIAAILAFAALRSAILARRAIGGLTDVALYTLENEYAAPHPVGRLWQGEIHLLHSFVVCRSRGRLLILPIHRIARVEHRFDRIGMQKLPFAKFVLDNGQTLSVGFAPSHPADSDAVFAWLAKRLKEEHLAP